jgi:hypothetical protein
VPTEHALQAGAIAAAGQRLDPPPEPPDSDGLDADQQEEDEDGADEPDDDRAEVGLDERIEVDRRPPGRVCGFAASLASAAARPPICRPERR